MKLKVKKKKKWSWLSDNVRPANYLRNNCTSDTIFIVKIQVKSNRYCLQPEATLPGKGVYVWIQLYIFSTLFAWSSSSALSLPEAALSPSFAELSEQSVSYTYAGMQPRWSLTVVVSLLQVCPYNVCSWLVLEGMSFQFLPHAKAQVVWFSLRQTSHCNKGTAELVQK